ncbi:MAG: glycosyltransferase family 4 protein [Candidatus Cloacimonetes bacterium]|nr:glycosyltransferase family 4 protein [Candidatus Cloacimonadota bacterium]
MSLVINRDKLTLFIHKSFSRIIKKDYNILKKYYPLRAFQYNPGRILSLNLLCIVIVLFNQIKMFIWLLRNICQAKYIYICGADYYALMPVLFAKVFKKKSIIRVGGYDAASIPQIKSGVFYKKYKALAAKISYTNADLIIPVDESLINSINYYNNKDGLSNGIKYFVKDLKTKIIVINNGYDAQKWCKKENIKREKTVLSIGSIKDEKTFKRKGFDLLIEIAKKMNGVKFILLGLQNDMYQLAKKNSTDNIELHHFIPHDELINYYSKAKVFCQLSLFEGFPNTLCEAMLCECIPVGSDVNGIPGAIGDCGFILKEKNADKAVKLIEKALNSSESLGKQARQRIKENFTLERRENKIIHLIEEMYE